MQSVNLTRLTRAGFLLLHNYLRTRRISWSFQHAVSHIEDAAAFSRLHPLSLAASTVDVRAGLPPSVNVIVPEVRSGAVFAGVRTALEFACAISAGASIPLRIISLISRQTTADRRLTRSYLSDEFNYEGQVALIGADQIIGLPVGQSDIWIGTHWTTAHTLDVARRLGVIAAQRIFYLIQDYEPGFHPWSTNFALARSTYHAGFHPIVNSIQLRQYLAATESIDVDDRYVFGPSLDMQRIKRIAELRRPSTAPRILFYGRPSKPRNLYGIGIAALSLVAEDLHSRGIDASFVSAGEPHESIRLSARHRLASRGRLEWDEYFRVLGESDVVLSLQLSPHPSHPPLDAVSSGAFAVTNELGGTRAGLHDRLFVAEPEPAALAKQILLAIDRSMEGDVGRFDPDLSNRCGGPMSDVIEHVLEDLVKVSSPSSLGAANAASAEDGRL